MTGFPCCWLTIDAMMMATDELLNQREKNKLLQDEMETTLHDIQNM